MKEFSPAMAPVMSFYSRPFYKDLANNGKGLGFTYLFLILLICWSAVCIHIYCAVDKTCRNKDFVSFVEQIPEMTCAEGKLSIDKPCPYTISSSGKPVFVFDTTGKMKTLSDAAPALGLFTTDYLVIKKERGAEETISWKASVPDFKLGQGILREFLAKLPFWLGIIAWVFGIFVWIGHMLEALFLGAVGLVMDRKKLGYGTSVRLGSFAMTPAIILSTVLTLFSVEIPWWPLISLLISVAFLYLAYSSVNEDA